MIDLIEALALLLPLCPGSSSQSTKKPSPDNVLIVMNTNSKDSEEVARYYAKKRDIASKYVCKIKCQTGETTSEEDYIKNIREPIKDYLIKNNLKDQIDYI